MVSGAVAVVNHAFIGLSQHGDLRDRVRFARRPLAVSSSMLLSVFVPLILLLGCGAVLAGRRLTGWTDPLAACAPGERVLAVIRPDAEVVLLLGALGLAAGAVAVSLGGAVLGSAAQVPLTLILLLVGLPRASGWFASLRCAWIVTDRRLIAGRALEVPLSDLLGLRILPLSVEVEARGDRLLRLPALINAAPAAHAIRAAALAHRSGLVVPITDFPRRIAVL
jgi:hypothetical protein